MRSFTDLIRSVGGVPGDSHLGVGSVPAPAEVAEALDIAPGAPVALIDRVRLIDGTPLAIANEYVALPKGEEDFERIRTFAGGSLYAFLRERCGVTLSHSTVDITAVAADTARARLLNVRRGTPLLLLKEPHYDVTGRPVLFAVNYHNSDLVDVHPRARGPTRMNRARYATLGNISIDDLVFADGTTKWCVPGGNAIYSGLGMAVWASGRR